MKRQASLSMAGSKASRRVALACSLTALGAGFFACSGEFKTACPEGSTQTAGGGDVNTACTPNDQMGNAGAGGGVVGTGGAGANGSGGASGSSGSGGEGGSGGQAGGGGLGGVAGTGGAGGGVVPGPPGTLDTSFGKGGKADLTWLPAGAGLFSFGAQASGAVVMLGSLSSPPANSDLLVARVGPTGLRDTGFATGKGYFVEDNDTTYYYGGVTAIQADDSILFAFDYYKPKSTTAKYLPDGLEDLAFERLRGQSIYNGPAGLALASDSFFVSLRLIGGTRIRKFHSDGSADAAWGAGAGLVYAADNKAEFYAPLVVDGDQRLYTAYVEEPSSFSVFNVAAYDAVTGKKDFAFGGSGVVTKSVGPASVSSIALDRNGRVVFAGAASEASALARVRRAGIFDADFGSGGLAVSLSSAAWRCVAVDANDNVLVAGGRDATDKNSILVARYTPAGQFDQSFGPDGTGLVELEARAPSGSTLSAVRQCGFDPQGRFLVLASGIGGPFLARLWN